MKVNEKLLNRLREALMDIPTIKEKTMFGGICFLVNDKMCICLRENRLMCRVGPAVYEECLEIPGCEPMVHGKRLVKGYVFVYEEAFRDRAAFDHWISLSLKHNEALSQQQ
ncbi:MAG: TfoX/Sxy family protein [Pseudosphingobacterium sp.]|nr:TfoX/Sxy family protein [Pseudosphingobacterium sp.]